MARARNRAQDEIGRITNHQIYNQYIEFTNRHGHTWRIAREPQMHVDLAVEASHFIARPEPWTFNRLYQNETPQPAREIVSNDRHSPNRQRRPASVPQGHNASRFGHSRRHNG